MTALSFCFPSIHNCSTNDKPGALAVLVLRVFGPGPRLLTKAFLPISTVAPTILGAPENAIEEVTVTINNPISLICEALAFPSPNITWMKDGVPFKASKNIQLLPGDAPGVGFEKTQVGLV